MKQTTLALITALAAGAGFAASGALSRAHEGREIAGYTDRVSYGTIARKSSHGEFSSYFIGTDEQTITMGPDGYMLKSGPCTLIHTEKRGGCEDILLFEDSNGIEEFVDGNCDGRAELIPDWPDYDYYPCDPNGAVRMGPVENEAGELVMPTLETHPELCSPEKINGGESALGVYVLLTRAALGIEQATSLWKQALEQQVCADESVI